MPDKTFVPNMVDKRQSDFANWYQPDSEIPVAGAIYRFSADGADTINKMRAELNSNPALWDTFADPRVPRIKLQKVGDRDYSYLPPQQVLRATGIVTMPLPQ